jgi:hypothetical protein
VTSEIWRAWDDGYRVTRTTTERIYYYVRWVRGTFRNNSEVSISVDDFSLSGNILRLGSIEGTQTVPVVRSITIGPGGTYEWIAQYESLGQRTTSTPEFSTLSRSESIQSFIVRSLDSRC